MTTSIVAHRARPFARRLSAATVALALLATATQTVAAAAPSNDLVANATPLSLGVSQDFDSTEATVSASDPTDCDGSHGPWPGPYFASVWFSFTAPSTGQFNLSAPTMQGDPDMFLAISFVYEQTASGLTLVDCTAFGNDATWRAKAGTTYLIMEAGLSSTVTGEPEFSDRGGTGTITITRTANEAHYSFVDFFTYSDCGFQVDGEFHGSGSFHLRPGKHGDPTPYVFDNYDWYAVHTNPDNGKWFQEQGNGLYRDLHITNVEGTVYTFVAQETGRPYSIVTSDGTKVFFDRGRLLTTFQVDTKGDDDLSNDEFVEDSWSLVAENGSHEAFFTEFDWCELVNDLIG